MGARQGVTWSPSSDDYLDALRDQNPWHEQGSVPEALSHTVRRPLSKLLWRSLGGSARRFQVVLGPRRVGKTVGLYQTIQALIEAGTAATRLWFLRMDHPLLMDDELHGWAKALIRQARPTGGNPLYLFLDEVNYSRNWDKWLKTFHDEQWPLRIVATSSSTAALRDRSVESGIGRWSEQYLTPYSFKEFLDLRGIAHPEVEAGSGLFGTIERVLTRQEQFPGLSQARKSYLLIGGFPELLLQREEDESIEAALLRSQQVLRSEAVQRVAAMDIPQVFDIKRPRVLERLVYMLAGQMCGLVNVSNLSASLEITRQTCMQYIHYLEQAFLVFQTHNYSTAEESVQRQGRKVYFVDGAVRNAALQRGFKPLNDPGEQGLLVENAVGAHLFGLALQTGMRLYHWRQGKIEVDFVYDDPEGPIAFEVTSSATHQLKGLRALQERYPGFQGRSFLVSSGSSIGRMPGDDGVGRLPLDALLVAIGLQKQRALAARLAVPA